MKKISCSLLLLCPLWIGGVVGGDHPNVAIDGFVEFPARADHLLMEGEVDTQLDCGFRRLFWEKAQAAVPWRKNNQDIKDALELCSGDDDDGDADDKKKIIPSKEATLLSGRQRRLSAEDHNQSEQDLANENSIQFYVCPETGRDSDKNEGNHTHPFRTLHRAIEATRARRRTLTSNNANTYPALIILRPGIHFLKKTLVLTPQDSNLTIRGHPETWISGGTLIPKDRAGWRQRDSDGPPTVWVTDALPSSISTDITGLFTVHPHRRLTKARYPNANVEEWNATDRYIQIDEIKTTDEWLFPPYAGVPDFSDYVNLMDPKNPTGHVKNDSTMVDYNSYGTGKGGACATVWGDLPSYWCSNVSAGGWAEVDRLSAEAGRLNLPAGLKLSSNSPLQQRVETLWNHKAAAGAIFHVAHTQGWAWHMFNVSQIVAAAKDENKDPTTTLHFDAGGWQGGRNWQCRDEKGHLTDCNGDGKKLHSGPMYVEGILEELDAPGEFYWDAAAKKLYLYPPDCDDDPVRNHHRKTESACHPPDLIATNLKTLVKVEGTQQNPVRNVRFEGIRLRDAAKTIMEQWSAPSGGDWALYRGGAIHLEGTENITIVDCEFRRLDGNAIMFGGYNRHATVARSEFAWLGEGAMATWGDTNGYDATGGAQTRMSIIEQNVMSNLGLYQKQSSAWGQNKACQNTIRNNVMFNLPRAAINFNDGLGGDNVVEGNVIFNTCRESGDHGPINSWDRMPFLSDITGVLSFSPLPTHTRHNLIWANYGASEGFDNDDGSSFYHTYNNCYYEADGFKMDYGGDSSRFTNNLVYSIGNKKCYGTASFKKGHGDIFSNNTCIVSKHDDSPQLGHMFQCALLGMNPTTNHYYTNTGNGTFTCGNQEGLTLQEIQKMGYERGSTLKTIPSADTILSWARDVLETPSPGNY